MKKILAPMWCVLLCGVAVTCYAEPRTAEEFEKDGLEHFRKAFYEATPRKDRVKANAEYVLAEKAFEEAIRRKPHRVEPYLHLGRTYSVQKKYVKAADVYKKALRLAPERKEIYLKLASALEMSGDYKEAIDILRQLRSKETDELAIHALDKFIQEFEKRASPR